QAFARNAEHAGDPHALLNYRHVAGLAALLFAEIAVQPLLIGHLLVERAHFFAARAQGLGDQRVTGGAELRFLDVLTVIRLKPTRRSLHDARLPFFDVEGAILGPRALAVRLVNDKPAVEALARSQLFFADLVTYRAGHAVGGLFAGRVIRVERQVAEYLALTSLLFGFITSY